MRIVIAGGSGFLGRPLAERLAAVGHHIVVLTRRDAVPSNAPHVRYITWDADGDAEGQWALEIDGAGAVINLAGAGIADKRWTAERKAEIKSSRILSTRSLVSAVRRATNRPGVFIQASGAGYYGASSGDREFDESFPPGADFLGEVAVQWEAEAHPVTALGPRLVIIRNGVVLAGDGGALKEMARPFRFFVGGPIASGKQYVPWIHRDDWIEMVSWALNTPAVTGVVNGTAPVAATNQDLSNAIGRALRRPAWFRVPGFVLQALFGEMAKAMLIDGQRVVPAHAQTLGFRYKYPAVEEAVAAALQ